MSQVRLPEAETKRGIVIEVILPGQALGKTYKKVRGVRGDRRKSKARMWSHREF